MLLVLEANAELVLALVAVLSPHLCTTALRPLPGLHVQAPQVSQVRAVSSKAAMDIQLVPHQRCCMAAAMIWPRACSTAHSSTTGAAFHLWPMATTLFGTISRHPAVSTPAGHAYMAHMSRKAADCSAGHVVLVWTHLLPA
jgi:hypothetical protein